MTHNVFDDTSAAISPADEDGVKHVLLNSILGLWDVVNWLRERQS